MLREEIVKKILERYQEDQGVDKEEKVASIVEDIITVRTITSKAAVPLEKHPSPLIRVLNSLYKRMENIVEAIKEKIASSKLLRKIDMDLYAADIPITASQYISLVVTASVVLSGISILITPLLIAAGLPASLVILIPPSIFIVSLLFGIKYPEMKAVARGREMEKELPFALRHLAVVIRSGMSLYNAMESIAAADYGVLSKEFKRTVKEISEGKTTEEALESMAVRSKSRSVRLAVSQIIRALRVGGGLSDAVKRIAEDVAFEQRNRIREFAEKLNLVGVVFMFAGIVLPSLLSILAGIGNAPLGVNLLQAFALPIETLVTIYLVGIPAFMLVILLFVKQSDPMGE